MAQSHECVVSAIEIPLVEQREIIELYRNALLTGSQAQLIGPAGQTHKIPKPVYGLLLQILKDLSEGSSVAVLQERTGLTTVQASRLLGVSRRFFINLLEKGEIDHYMVGTHRRVSIRNLMDYKKKRDAGRRAVLNQMVQSEIETGAYDVVPDDFNSQ